MKKLIFVAILMLSLSSCIVEGGDAGTTTDSTSVTVTAVDSTCCTTVTATTVEEAVDTLATDSI